MTVLRDFCLCSELLNLEYIVYTCQSISIGNIIHVHNVLCYFSINSKVFFFLTDIFIHLEWCLGSSVRKIGIKKKDSGFKTYMEFIYSSYVIILYV
jgi:hypothetical protein